MRKEQRGTFQHTRKALLHHRLSVQNVLLTTQRRQTVLGLVPFGPGGCCPSEPDAADCPEESTEVTNPIYNPTATTAPKIPSGTLATDFTLRVTLWARAMDSYFQGLH